MREAQIYIKKHYKTEQIGGCHFSTGGLNPPPPLEML